MLIDMRTWFKAQTRADKRRLKRGLYPCKKCGNWKRVPKYDKDPRAGFYQENAECNDCLGIKKDDTGDYTEIPSQYRGLAAKVGKKKYSKALKKAGVKKDEHQEGTEEGEGKEDSEEGEREGHTETIEGEGSGETDRVREANFGDTIIKDEEVEDRDTPSQEERDPKENL
jgi:hypothetical protein